MASSQPQTNGIASSSANTSQTIPNTQATANSQPDPAHPTQSSSSASARPRDARLIELLLTSQGVTAYEQRVPLLLMDFAYRHTSSVLNDALHLSGDPYVSHAGAKASASAGATAALPGDATVSGNAVKLAIGARLSYQFRGGSGGGGISKEYMQELARERNKVALPKIVPNEWGVRLPSERFVLSGSSWGLRNEWPEASDSEGEEEEEEGDDAMQGIQGPELEDEDVGGEDVEGGTVEDVFGNDVDEEMAEE